VFDVPTAEELIQKPQSERSMWEGDQELVERSVWDESTWDVTHLYMEAMLGISLYSYPYLNYLKCFVFLIIAYTFSLFNKIRDKGRTDSAWK
jgi:hypothetical protein